MVDRTRTRTLNVRVTDEEGEMARALAERHGLTISDVIRQYIRRAFVEAFPPKKPKK